MTPEQFIAKWRDSTRSERSAAHEHFLDLCELLEVPKPQDEDRHGETYTFEKLIVQANQKRGFADVWRKGCFAWEYKRPGQNLVAAYVQLKGYADALENPPLLIVSDMQDIRVHTNFTNTPSLQLVIRLADLNDPDIRRKLKWCFLDPERLRPTATRETVTQDAARLFGAIAKRLRDRKLDPRKVAHFLNRLVFCLFAADIGLLPRVTILDILEESVRSPEEFPAMIGDLFHAMREKNSRFGSTRIPWFNGGLFDDDEVLPLSFTELRDLLQSAGLDWSAIDPSIFGTLFEAGLDPAKRAAMASLFDPPNGNGKNGRNGSHVQVASGDKGVGIHYTDPATILKVIEPVVIAPLRREWEAAKAEIARHREARDRAGNDAARTRAETEARDIWTAFRVRLGRFRVLDPACGSGNFLYLALRKLKDFDLEVIREGERLGLPLDDQRVTPAAVRGIEVNPYAAELARVTIWIGELQWQFANAFGVGRMPILGKLDAIEDRDALLNPDGTAAAWPDADVVVGNPPFLGGKRLRGAFGDGYVESLFAAYSGEVPEEADLVCYWFAKAWRLLRDGGLKAAGLVATNSIRGGANRHVLDPIAADGVIFDAWDDEAWFVDNVAVRVSVVCFAAKLAGANIRLDGSPTTHISADLSGSGLDLTKARRLPENAGVAFMGDTKGGAFDIDGDLARRWLLLPANPNGRPNSDVLLPWLNGRDFVRRPLDNWIIDFEWKMSESEAAFYEAPFEYVRTMVKPERLKNRRAHYRDFWWRHVEPRPGMWRAIGESRRYLATPTVTKHRLFGWLSSAVCPDHQLIVIARDDDTTFGILQSRFHETWSLRLGTWLGVGNDPRYTPTTTFETFPFPEGLTPNLPAASYARDPRAQAIAVAAKRLDELRNAWLNPPDLVEIVPEVVPGYPDRILPISESAAAVLKARTLTSLYNQRPTWLADAHRDLDAAVAAAYGWSADIVEDDFLSRLLDLNRERA